MIAFDLSPIQIIQTLSMALEMTVSGINQHQQRTAVITYYLSNQIGLAQQEQHQLVTAALLHDIGAAPSMDERLLILTACEGKPLNTSLYVHAKNGAKLLEKSLCFNNIATIIRFHHDKWAGGNPSGLSGEAIPLGSRIIHLAGSIDTYVDHSKHIFSQTDKVEKKIMQGRGINFDPTLVDAFRIVAQQDCFWLDIMNPQYASSLIRHSTAWAKTRLTPQELLNIAEIYATLIDRTSSFTANHSRSVSSVAVLLAQEMGFCESERYMMRVAGLLHDLGKLSLPCELLEKQGPLSPYETKLVRQHTYFTFRILERIGPFKTIAYWAALHHETLDGKGYPFKLSKTHLPLGSRIMAVADVFVALAEDRPYRSRISKKQLKAILLDMVASHKLDARVVKTLFANYEAADAIVTAGTLYEPPPYMPMQFDGVVRKSTM